MKEIQLLYFDGCPSWQTALANLRQVIETESLDFQVHLIEITSSQQAQEERFLGSPSFRLNSVDLWPETRTRYNMSCRVYQTDQGMRGSPTVEMLREKIQEILAN